MFGVCVEFGLLYNLFMFPCQAIDFNLEEVKFARSLLLHLLLCEVSRGAVMVYILVWPCLGLVLSRICLSRFGPSIQRTFSASFSSQLEYFLNDHPSLHIAKKRTNLYSKDCGENNNYFIVWDGESSIFCSMKLL